MPLETRRRVAVDRHLALHCCVARLGVVRGQASEPQAFNVEGCGFCVGNGEVDCTLDLGEGVAVRGMRVDTAGVIAGVDVLDR